MVNVRAELHLRQPVRLPLQRANGATGAALNYLMRPPTLTRSSVLGHVFGENEAAASDEPMASDTKLGAKSGVRSRPLLMICPRGSGDFAAMDFTSSCYTIQPEMQLMNPTILESLKLK